jgi:hypothetical protein
MDLNDILKTSADVIDFNTSDKKLVENNEFMMAWGIARTKAMQTIFLINAISLIKNKYNISDFELQLFLENFDERNMLK